MHSPHIPKMNLPYPFGNAHEIVISPKGAIYINDEHGKHLANVPLETAYSLASNLKIKSWWYVGAPNFAYGENYHNGNGRGALDIGSTYGSGIGIGKNAYGNPFQDGSGGESS